MRDGHAFMWRSVKNFVHFQYFNFETDLLENKNFLKKIGVQFFSWTH